MPAFTTVDAYLAAQSPEVADRLATIRAIFHEVLPNTEESIRYDMPAFTVGSGHLYVAAYQRHIGMYPAYGITQLADRLEPYRGKGTKDSLHFRHTHPLPLDLIEDVIRAKATTP